MFQKTVNRQFTTGFAGDIVRDGPKRAKPARLNSTNAASNVISRAFGFLADIGTVGSNVSVTQAADASTVAAGGVPFYGVLGHPKHYALYGTAAGGALSPTMTLPNGLNAEFFDMVTGMVAEIFNETTAVKDVKYGDTLAYVSTATTAGQNPNNLPLGALISVPQGSAVPAGFQAIPNSMVTNPVLGMAASSPTVLSSTLTIIQLTQ